MPGVKGRSGGHNKKTLREKQLIGVRKDRLCENPPVRVGERTLQFDGLGEVGKKIFDIYEPMLWNNGTLDTPDSLAFFMLCSVWERWYLKLLELKTKGDYLPTMDKDGNITGYVTSPTFKQEADLLERLNKLLAAFGLNSRDRGNVEKIVRGEKINKFEGITK